MGLYVHIASLTSDAVYFLWPVGRGSREVAAIQTDQSKFVVRRKTHNPGEDCCDVA